VTASPFPPCPDPVSPLEPLLVPESHYHKLIINIIDVDIDVAVDVDSQKEFVETRRLGAVEVVVRVVFSDDRETEPTELSATLHTSHLVTAVNLLHTQTDTHTEIDR